MTRAESRAATTKADGPRRPPIAVWSSLWGRRPNAGLRESVAAYHQARLAELIEHIAAAVDRYRTGEIDAYTFDETIHLYHRAARELGKFCWSGGSGTHVELVAHLLDQMANRWRNHQLVGTGHAATARMNRLNPDPPIRCRQSAFANDCRRD
jgi:hypothetical protein